MRLKAVGKLCARSFRTALVCAAAFQFTLGGPLAFAEEQGPDDHNEHTSTPIKHVIVIIGENRSFDHVFATYQAKRPGETVWNLLSQGIINAGGGPGTNAAAGFQFAAEDTAFGAAL